MNFGQLLKCYIHDSEKSIRLFSEITELNRGFLYNIFAGKKRLPEDKFHKILVSFPFSDTQKENLALAFYKEIYGTNNFNKLQYIISELKHLKDFTDEDFSFSRSSNHYNKETEYITGKDNIIDAITFLLQSSSSFNLPFVYTNFDFSQKEIDSVIYSLILQNDIDLKHIIKFDNDSTDIYNLSNIFNSIKYARKKYNTYYYYCNQEILLDNLFPFYLVANSGILLYDSSLYHGLLIRDDSVINNFKDRVETTIDECTPLVIFPDNVFELKQILEPNSFIASISSVPCITPFLSIEMLHDMASITLENKDYVIGSLHDWYNVSTTEAAIPYTNLNTVEGFINFAEKGTVPYFPAEYARPLSVENRIKILEKCITENNQHHNFYLADDTRISFPDYINIELSAPNKVVMYGSFHEPEHSYMGEFIIPLSNNILYSDCNNFKDYVIRNNLYKNDSFTELFIKNLIRKLKSQ